MSPRNIRRRRLRVRPPQTQDLQRFLLFALAFLLLLQCLTFVGYHLALPHIQISNLIPTQQSKTQEADEVESSFDVRIRQLQGVIQYLNRQRKDQNIKDKAIDVSPETNGGVVGLFEQLVQDIVSLASQSNILYNGTLNSCYEYLPASSSTLRLFDTQPAPLVVQLSDKCKATNVVNDQTTLLLYNPYRHTRKWCGNLIGPGEIIKIDKLYECEQEWMNLALYPPPTLHHTDHEDRIEVVTSNYVEGDRSSVRNVACDVPCRWKGEPYGTFYIKGTPWKYLHSQEGPQYFSEVRVDPTAYRRNQFYSTTSFQSEIPLPYFSWAEYDLKAQPAVKFHEAIRGASFLANNCESKNNREKWVREIISSGSRVDALSGCLHNAEPPGGMSLDDKAAVQRKYLFHLAFENQSEDDYVTEKLWGTLASGTVPVYLGAPNVRDHAPANSIIVATDFDSPKALGEYLIKVSSDRSLYESFHAWRDQEYSPSFVEKYNFTHTHSECRTCRWAYAKKYGLGWNHEQQQMTSVRSSGDVCSDEETGFAVRPLKESYLILDSPHNFYRNARTQGPVVGGSSWRATIDAGPCSKRGLQSPFLFKHFDVDRSISEHDNVIDIFFAIKLRHAHRQMIAPSLYLRLETGIANGGLYFTSSDHRSELKRHSRTFYRRGVFESSRHFMMQDSSSRFSVWADWKTEMLSLNDGAVNILLSDGLGSGNGQSSSRFIIYRKLLLILEDNDQLHYDSELGDTSYFSRSEAKEFYRPLELFYAYE